MRKPKTFVVGDRVAYSAGWLKSTGTHTGDMPFLRGSVIAIMSFAGGQLCTIAWDLHGRRYWFNSHYSDDGFGRVINANLTLVARIAEDAALAS
jgi:hypothetical protein